MTKTKITPITLEGILRVIGVKYIYQYSVNSYVID